MKRFRLSTYAVASVSALALTLAGAGTASAQSFGSSGGGSSGGGSSGGSSHGSFFSGHGSSGGSKHASLFAGHGSYGGSVGTFYGGVTYPSPQFGMNSGIITGSSQVASVTPSKASVAYLNVSVPADAKVYLQDQLMTLEGTQRRFVSPELPAGTQHTYNVRVDVVRNGQTVSKTTQALVAPGQEVAISVQLEGQDSKELVATVATVASR